MDDSAITIHEKNSDGYNHIGCNRSIHRYLKNG